MVLHSRFLVGNWQVFKLLLHKNTQLLRHINYFALNFMKKKKNNTMKITAKQEKQKQKTKILCDHNKELIL